MCGRYTLEDADKLESKFKAYSEHFKKIDPNWNVAPTQIIPVVTENNGQRQLQLMYWGIPRMLGKDLVKELINTRSEKAFDRFWNKIVTHNRCLIPANAFYEWRTLPDGKHPFYIQPKDQDLFAFAGIWNQWTDKEGKPFNAYSIMTTEPNKEMRQIHTRMPVILHEDDYDSWLSGSNDRNEIEPLLRPYQDNGLEMHEVGKAVNNVRNNYSELLEPI